MFGILLVDDERIILHGIRLMIEEELELSFETDIVTASHVLQAKELLQSFQPDLILTDIRMPVLDGFALIKHVREENLSMNIVILTSHADFEYARQAVRYGVSDFILKPVSQEKLKEIIESTYQKKMDREQKQLQTFMAEVRNMMLYDLSTQELTGMPEQIGRLFPFPYYTVIVLSFSKTEEGCQEELERILLQYYNGVHCFLLQERSQLIAICNHNQFSVRPPQLEQELSDMFHCEVSQTGISISATSCRALHSLYVNAVQRIFYAAHFGQGSGLSELSMMTWQDCVRIFQENDMTTAFRLMEEYLTKVEAAFTHSNSPDMIYRSFFHNILLYLENNRISVTSDLIHTACHSNNYQELIPEILALLSTIKGEIQRSYHHLEQDTLVKQLLTYIRQHYQEEVSLGDLAEHVGLHPNYICGIFKKNIGQSYLACLHGERLKAAKRLLDETDYTMEQIAGQVGYNSASQLARVFRRYENISPSAFRNLP